MRIRINQSDITETYNMLGGIKNAAPRAISRALNKTLVNVRTRAVKDLGADLNLKAARIKKDFSIKKSVSGELSAALICKSRSPGLINFGAKQVKSGVSYKVKKIGPRKTWKHAFIGSFTNKAGSPGNTHVAVRTWSGPRKKFRPNFKYGALPFRMKKFKVIYGPRIASVLSQPGIMVPLETFASERVSINLMLEINNELRKLK